MDEKKIHSIIDEAMAARDRSVSIYISPDGGVSVSVFPWPDEEGTPQHESQRSDFSQ